MVKRQREKQYQSAQEHRAYSQIRSGSQASGSTVQRRLPFTHCALTLVPFEEPVCTSNGIVFENSAILPFLMKHKVDPVSGKPMTSRDLIALNMDKDEDGKWQCPVLGKPFSDHTKIIAIIQPDGNEANVLSYDAYYELNVKSKNWEDLISGNKFDKKKDVLVISDPNDDEFNRMRDINTFYHMTHSRELEKEKGDSGSVRHSMTATRVMEKLQKNKEEAQRQSKKRAAEEEPAKTTTKATTVIGKDGKRLKVLAKDVTGVDFSTGRSASSFTSTGEDLSYKDEAREATEEEILQARFKVMKKLKKKGYVRLCTSVGDMTLELHCDMVPRTCTNFLGLCEGSAYNDSKFHRLIRNFMIQGGKSPAGEEDESLWGGPFSDEFDDRLKHDGAGIVSMANAGRHTNRRQFFITFKSQPHLDRKHSVFGTVIDGMKVLSKISQVETDAKERPKKEIKILGTVVLENPAKEAEALELQRLEKAVEAREAEMQRMPISGKAIKVAPSDLQSTSGVGRYLKKALPQPAAKTAPTSDDSTLTQRRLPPPPKATKFRDFSGW